jgi:signal transduction histidine kinase/ligand-binding sensor domain-containing protein
LKKHLIYILIIIYFQKFVLGQERFQHFEHLSDKNGLYASYIQHSIIDSFNYVWLATNNGLYRYDGANLLLYKHDSDNPNSIGPDAINFIFEMTAAILLLGTDGGGVEMFNKLSGEVSKIDLQSSIGEDVKWIDMPDKYTIIVGTGSGFYKIDYINNKWISHKLCGGFSVQMFCKGTNSGDYFLATDVGLKKINIARKKLENYDYLLLNTKYKQLEAVYADGNKIWCGGRKGGLMMYDLEQKKVKQFFSNIEATVGEEFVSHIIPETDTTFLIGQICKGVFRFHKKTGVYEKIKLDENEIDNPICVRHINFYKNKMLWISTLEKGMYFSNLNAERFSPLKIDKEWVTKNKGVRPPFFSMRRSKFSAAIFSQSDKFDILQWDDDFSLKKAYGFSLPFYYKTRMIEVDTAIFVHVGSSVVMYELIKQDTLTIKIKTTNNEFFYDCFVRNNLLYIASQRKGLSIYDWKKRKMIVDNDLRFGTHVLSFLQKGENLYLSTPSAIYLLRNGKIDDHKKVKISSKNPYKMTSMDRLTIGKDKKIYTNGLNKGLQIFNQINDTVWTIEKTIYTKEGLQNSHILDLQWGIDGRLWMSTEYGLYSYNISTGLCKRYGKEQGLSFTNFTHGSLYVDSNKVVASDGNDLFVMKMHKTDTNKVIAINSINIDDDVKIYSGQNLPQRVIIEPGVKKFEINFSPMSYNGSELDIYYRLLPQQEAWNHLNSDNNTLQLTYLGYGNHILEYRIGNEENATERKIEIQKKQRWYLKSTTLIFALLAISLIIVYFILKSLNLAKVQAISDRNLAEAKLKLVEDRHRISQDLHDEVGSSLLSISILAHNTLVNVADEKTKNRIDDIGSKTRDLMKSISDIVWAIDPSNDSLEKIISRIVYDASQLFEDSDILFQYSQNGDIAKTTLSMDKRKEIYLICKEIINNCAKHSNAKEVTLTVDVEEDFTSIIIKDDGCGFDEKTVVRGNGLNNIQERCTKINAKLDIISELNKGSIVKIQWKTN